MRIRSASVVRRTSNDGLYTSEIIYIETESSWSGRTGESVRGLIYVSLSILGFKFRKEKSGVMLAASHSSDLKHRNIAYTDYYMYHIL
jgi:hypothetical protein